jgi:hypothetical protein
MRTNMNRWLPWPVVGGCFGVGWRMVILAVSAVLFLAGISCCSKSTKPKDVKYNIYISATGYRGDAESTRFDQFYVYDADSITLRDSIPLSTKALELEVSPDGRWLYAQCTSWGRQTPGGLYKIDALTRQAMWSIPGNAALITLLDGGRLLTRELLEETEVIDAATGDVITRLPSTIRILKGPPNGTKVAAVVPDSTIDFLGDSAVTVYDVKSGAVHGLYVPRLSTGEAFQAIYTARLHPDGKRVMVIGVYGPMSYCWFMVGDVESGETLLRHRLYSPFGEIAVSFDGVLAVASDPSSPGGFGSTREAVEFFDLSTLEHLKTLDWTSDILPPTPSQVHFVLDDRKIAIAPTSSWIVTGPFCIVDRATLSVERFVELPYHEPNVGALGAGPRP